MDWHLRSRRWSTGFWVTVCVAWAAAVLAFDLSLPLGVAGGVPYVVLVLLSWWAEWPPRSILVAAIAGTVLTVLGFFLSPRAGILWMVLANRGLALFVIWVTAMFCIEHKRAEAKRRKIEAHAQQAEHMKTLGVLAGGIAHDFNNMLGLIAGNSELALAELEPGSKTHNRVKKVLVATERSMDMVKRILTFSRRSKPEKAVINLGAVVEETIELVRTSLPAGVAIRQEIDNRVPVVLADPTQVQQVILNLCLNAGYAMREGGDRLTLSTHRVTADQVEAHPEAQAREYVRLAVRDTGCGIAPEILIRVFEPFFSTKNGDGTGMGLTTCHGIAAAHGGFMTVESELGIGSVFHLYLPRHSSLEVGMEDAADNAC